MAHSRHHLCLAAELFPGARFLAMLVPHKLAVRAFDHPARLCAKEVTMSETNLANATRRSPELSVGVAAGAILALMAGATWFGSALAQQKEEIPNFSLDSKSA